MAFIPQFSVTAQKTKVSRTHVRSKALPCFSKIQDETRPFFIQWNIRAIDVSRIMSVSYDDARQKMQQMRNYYGKQQRALITIDEFCAYTNIKKSYVRMHVVSRKMENEMIKAIESQFNRVELETRNCKLGT